MRTVEVQIALDLPEDQAQQFEDALEVGEPEYAVLDLTGDISISQIAYVNVEWKD